MTKKIYNPDNGITVPTFSTCVVHNKTAYLAGMASIDTTTGDLVNGDIEFETRNTFKVIEEVLSGIGSTMEDILMVNVFLTNMDDFDGMNKVFKETFPENPPARITVGVSDLNGVIIEMSVVAATEY